MSSSIGKNLTFTIFGQSHSKAIGVTAEGLPTGFKPDMDRLAEFMARRAPGKNDYSTKRNEKDQFTVLSGIKDDVFCGAPFAAMIENKDARSKDYSQLKEIPRPGHADYTAQIKFGGNQDVAGGGHFSGRLTAPMCIIGGICLQILEAEGIHIAAHIERIAGVKDNRFDPVNFNAVDHRDLAAMTLPVLNSEAGEKMSEAILAAREDGDSVGGVIECGISGLPAGIGDPMFDGMENVIARMVFGVPAVKGIEFGAGFAAAELRGSQNNDDYTVENGEIRTKTNNAGGILGGITSGMPLIFRAAIKPTPSIFRTQQSISLKEMRETELQIQGRHDPCIVPRAVPVIEAAAAIAVYDSYLDYIKGGSR